jgi:pyrroline-5-carboxylate reductase
MPVADAKNFDLALIRLGKIHQALDQGGLSRPIDAHQAKKLARLNIQIQPVQYDTFAVGFAELFEMECGWRHKADKFTTGQKLPLPGGPKKPTSPSIHHNSILLESKIYITAHGWLYNPSILKQRIQTTMNITFIGGGNMASALIGGLVAQGFDASHIHVVDVSRETREALQARYPVQTFAAMDAEAVASEVIVLAVKPQQLREVAASLAPLLHRQLVISIAAGVRAGDLSRWLGGYRQLVRSMPNTPAMVSAGMSGLYALPEVAQPQRQQAETVLQAVGETLWLEEEAQMDAITAVSGSGPAYVFYFMEAMQAAATELGFSPRQARALTLQTFLGAARLASQSEEDAATLRARVTSKGGTTERALSTMDEAAVKTAIIQAIHAAAGRSRELGDALGKE